MLDREWAAERETYLIACKNGAKREHDFTGSLIRCLIFAGFGIILTFSPSKDPWLTSLFGLFIIGLAILGFLSGSEKAAKLKVRRAEYETRRAALQTELTRIR